MGERASTFLAKERGGTIYIVECIASETAKDTASEKVKRLILHDTESLKTKAAS